MRESIEVTRKELENMSAYVLRRADKVTVTDEGTTYEVLVDHAAGTPYLREIHG